MTSGDMAHEVLDPRQHAERVLADTQRVLGEAAAIVGHPDVDPLQVFPKPGEVRADDEGLALDESRATELREKAAELGYGRHADRTMSELGFSGAHVVAEGGQVHKVIAEIKMIDNDTDAAPASITLAGGKRLIKPEEVEIAARLLDLPSEEIGRTEYDMVRQAAKRLDGFEPLENDEVAEFGYDITQGNAMSSEPTGQLVTIGYRRGAPVRVLRIDREDYTDENGKPKYRNQPDTAAVIGLASATLPQGEPVAFATSATYEASRNVDAARAALVTGRAVGVVSYGTERLATVKGVPVPADGPINQLPGELHRVAEQAQRLEGVLWPKHAQ